MVAGQGLLVPDTRYLGVYYDDPAATPKRSLRSEACLTVSIDWEPRGALELLEIRGGRSSVVLHIGPYAQLGRAYTWLYGEWLSGSGRRAVCEGVSQ
jgi:AraC family transcriptional regulator